MAFVILFPIGSILMRVIPGRFAVWVHAVFQVLAWGVYVAAAALGIYLVRVVQIPGGGLVSFGLLSMVEGGVQERGRADWCSCKTRRRGIIPSSVLCCSRC